MTEGPFYMADHITPHLTWRSESAVRVSPSASPPSLGWYPREHLITSMVSVRCALTAVKQWDWLMHLQYLNWYSMTLATPESRVQFPGKMWIKMITFKMHCMTSIVYVLITIIISIFLYIISCFQYSLQCVISHAQSIAWAHIHSLLCFTKLVKLVLYKTHSWQYIASVWSGVCITPTNAHLVWITLLLDHRG